MGEDTNPFLRVEEQLLNGETVGEDGGLEMFTRPQIEGAIMVEFHFCYAVDDPWMVDLLDAEDKVQQKKEVRLTQLPQLQHHLPHLVVLRHQFETSGKAGIVPTVVGIGMGSEVESQVVTSNNLNYNQ